MVKGDTMNSAEGTCSSMEVAYDHGDDQLHVLAVDDNLIDRMLMEKLLKNSSCRVTTAENGLWALEYLGLGDDQHTDTLQRNVSNVKLIITDYCMPEMTGFELLKKVKESSCLSEIPVVIISSENPYTYQQVLRGRSTDVCAQAAQTIRYKETQVSYDELQKLSMKIFLEKGEADEENRILTVYCCFKIASCLNNQC